MKKDVIEITDNPAEREKIIRFAQEYYMREGFYKTSMDTLAAELKMSKKTIYKYFPSKDILVEEVVGDLMMQVQTALNQLTAQKTDAVTKLKMLHEILGKTITRFSEKWLNDMRIHAPELWQKVDEFRTRRMFIALSGIFEQGKKEGLFLDKPNEILVTIFTASLRAIVNPEFLYHNKFSYRDAVVITFDILFNGFLTKEGTKIFKRKLKEI
jgi:AcrR family transcriptional regulator